MPHRIIRDGLEKRYAHIVVSCGPELTVADIDIRPLSSNALVLMYPTHPLVDAGFSFIRSRYGGKMVLLTVFFLVSIGVSFLCSLMESVILSVSNSYIAILEKEGHSCGAILRRLKRKIDHPLAAILTLNTVANTAGASAIGAQVFRLFGSEWVALSSGILTVLILVFSEVIPKTLGAAHWKQIAPYAGYIIIGLIWITYPIVRLLEAISGIFSRKAVSNRITREEIVVHADIGSCRKGAFPDGGAHHRNPLLSTRYALRYPHSPPVITAIQKDLPLQRR